MTLKLEKIENIGLVDSPIFIVGCSRSGTTLLKKILHNHKNIFSVKYESDLFNTKGKSYIHKTSDNYEKNKDFDNLALFILSLCISKGFLISAVIKKEKYPSNVIQIFNELKNNLKECKNKYDVFNLCINYITLKENKKRWVEKTPGNIHSVPHILSLYPDAKFVEIYRDPRAVYLSSTARTPNDIRIISPINRWYKAIKQGEKLSKEIKSQYYRLCYENLIKNPEYELRKLCDFLNEDFDPNMLNIKIINSSFFGIEGQNGFSTIPIDHWKKSLSTNEILLIDILTKKYRKQLNYPDSDIKLSFLVLLSFSLYLIILCFSTCISLLLRIIRKIMSRFGITIYYQKLYVKYLFLKIKKIFNGEYKKVKPLINSKVKDKIAYLTIDDSPSIYFRQKVDYLFSKDIPAIFFCQGDFSELLFDDVVYAIKKGFIIGNHSYNHRSFSQISASEACNQIKETDKIIESAYRQANIQRPAKLFRCPYGDKGGKNKDAIQAYLQELDYIQPEFDGITYEPFYIFDLHKDIDMYWTYDIKEYRIKDLNKIFKRMSKKPNLLEGSITYPNSNEIIIIHDHEDTNEIFFKVIDRLIDMGLQFKLPQFYNNNYPNRAKQYQTIN